jgi:hypothetical protein
MAVTRAAQNAARAALLKPFRVKPFFDSFKAYFFVALIFHEIARSEIALSVNFITRK